MLDCGERGKLGYRENTSQSGVENQQVQLKYGKETSPTTSTTVRYTWKTNSISPLTILSYPTYTSVLLRAIEWWYHDPNVSTPVLKLMAELVQNRSQRLHFDVSSPNGILLFRVTSEMIVAYGKCCCVCVCLFVDFY